MRKLSIMIIGSLLGNAALGVTIKEACEQTVSPTHHQAVNDLSNGNWSYDPAQQATLQAWFQAHPKYTTKVISGQVDPSDNHVGICTVKATDAAQSITFTLRYKATQPILNDRLW